jgi:hypothetical protein
VKVKVNPKVTKNAEFALAPRAIFAFLEAFGGQKVKESE